MKENTRLIITADDYGVVPSINRGIESALENRVVNTVSAFVNGRDAKGQLNAPSVIRALKTRFPDANIGVHLTITSGGPVRPPADVRSLLKKDGSGEFMNFNRFCYPRVHRSELEREIRAQMNLFRESGVEMDHISSHHGMLTLFPDFFDFYMALAAENDVPIRNPIPISRLGHRGFRFSKVWEEGIKAGLGLLISIPLPQLIGVFRHIHPKNLQKTMDAFADKRLRYAGYLIDTFYRMGSEGKLKRILNRLPPEQESELIVHLKDSRGRQETPEEIPNGVNSKHFPERERELETLLKHAPIQNLLERNGIVLGSFRDVPNRG